MKPKIYIFQRTKKQKILIFPTFCPLLVQEKLYNIANGLFGHIII